MLKTTKDFDNLVKDIPVEFKYILNHLHEAEGGEIHRNSTESDITTSYGIYAAVHPTANVFSYLSSVYKDLYGYIKPTNKWTSEEIDKVNKNLNPETARYMNYLFYKNYFSGARLELFTPIGAIIMTDLYTNSMEGAWMSVQEALRDLSIQGILDIPLNRLSIVDGDYGAKTKRGLVRVKKIHEQLKDINIEIDNNHTVIVSKLFDYALAASTTSSMKSYYMKLVTGNYDKYGRYGMGWDNRMENTEHLGS